MPILETLAVGSGIANALGGLFGGRAKDKESKRQAALQGRQLDMEAGDRAIGVQRGLDMTPIRDRIMFMLQNRLGQSPGQFRPADVFNMGSGVQAGPVQLGGVNLDDLAQQNAGYKPGMGGANSSVAQQVLRKLGYGGQAPNRPANWMEALTQSMRGRG